MSLEHKKARLSTTMLVLLASVAGTLSAAAQPSLVLVTIDTLRADRLGCYGYHRDTSPNLDKLAEEAILFERAYTTMATTLPAHASIMTGTHPMTHGVQANASHFPRSLEDARSVRTLAEMLVEQGYETAAFVSAAPLKRHSGIDRGFESFSQPTMLQRSSAATTKKALRWLENRSDEPFFLWVHYFDPHWPYTPPWSYKGRFRQTPELVTYLEEIGVKESKSRKIQRINNAYDGEILYTDHNIGLLFERLKELGIWDEAVVVVTADHGEGLGQHDYLYHGRIYNEQLKVPLLVKLQRMREARRSSAVTSLVDLLPILHSVADLPISAADREQFQGVDTLSNRVGTREVLSERVHRNGSWGPARRYALIGPDWKYFHSPTEPDSLYDLRTDPYETRNVIDQHPEVANQLRAKIADRIREHYREPSPGEATEIDEETRKQLRALGYIE